MPRQHLHRLEVGKRTEDVQRFSVRQAPHDLHLAQETLAASIGRSAQSPHTQSPLCHYSGPEPLAQPLSRHQIRFPPRVAAEMQPKGRGQVLASCDHVVRRE